MKTTMQNQTRRLGNKCMVFVLTACASAIVCAQNAIESVSGVLQGGTEIVRIDMSEPLSVAPTGFAVQSPARIALDFPGVSSKLPRGIIEMNQGNLRSAQVVQGAGRTRVVLNLRQFANYRTALHGKTLLLSLDPIKTVTPAQTKMFAESLSQTTQALRNIDFRRGGDASGRVVIDLPNNQVGIDIRPKGQSLVVDFLKSSLPQALRKTFDVSDFGTPVQSISATENGERVRMVIAARGEWEHSAYQTDNQLVIELHPLKVDPNALNKGPGYKGDKLSLNFQNIDIRSLLQVIADFTNFNIVTSDSVTGSLTLRLKDVPWDQALDVILRAKNLGMKKSGNVIWVAPKDELQAKEKAELESSADIEKYMPIRTEAFQLNYAKASDIAEQLRSSRSRHDGDGAAVGAGTLSPRGAVIVNVRTNQLFVTDIPSAIERVREMLAKLDVPVRQVQIEARIVEATDTWGRELGTKMAIMGPNRRGGTGTNLGIGIPSVYNSNSGGGDGAPVETGLFNLPAAGLSGAAPAHLALAIFTSNASRWLNLEISALEADGQGKVISSPRVITADQTKALIEQGTELPYQSATSSGATAVQFRKANLKLEVTPQITPEGNVMMDLDVNKDAVGIVTADGYAIDTRHIKTSVLVENGGTVVIGGIYTMEEQKSTSKVPLLGDIPVIGNLFKHTGRSRQKKEMLVFITPKIVSERGALR